VNVKSTFINLTNIVVSEVEKKQKLDMFSAVVGKFPVSVVN